MLRVVVIGARRRRQGIGGFVARWLHQAGAQVVGVVGSTQAGAAAAAEALRQHGIDAGAFADLDAAVGATRPDAIAICSPIECHPAHLDAAVAHRLHCLAEKPLIACSGSAEEGAAYAASLVDRFDAIGRHLALITQWPEVLDSFRELHPGTLDRPVERFEMRLSPISTGTTMALDSVSHPLSMLLALCGAGRVDGARAEFGAATDDLTLRYRWVHADGTTEVVNRFRTCPEPPRPASFAVNGSNASREIELPDYRQHLADGDHRVPLADPLQRLVERFVRNVESGVPIDRDAVVDGMRGLETLVAATAEAECRGPESEYSRMSDDTRAVESSTAGPTRDGETPKKQVELTPIHDFASKLLQPEVLPQLKEYVEWQSALRSKFDDGVPLEEKLQVPNYAPVSINLDLTTACNYACDHCVDMDILNLPIRYDHEKLLASMKLMAERGLRSVIVIGGGEPTTYKYFEETIHFMKDLGLQISIVSNGSGMKRIAKIAHRLDEQDWVRLSLDSGTDPTFQAMHKPKRKITLESICEEIPGVKDINPRFPIGFSFIVTWKGAFINDSKIVENLDEMVTATELAKKNRFDYIAIKPFLTRAEANNAEIVDLKETDDHFDRVIVRIREMVDKAKQHESDTFKVYETTNLKMLENRSASDYMHQPQTCHMQFFRQVLSPLGMYNCPVYRNQNHGRVGSLNAYADEPTYDDTRRNTAKLIDSFNATQQCKEVTCLYNHVNWFIEDLIHHPEKLAQLEARAQPVPDYFL